MCNECDNVKVLCNCGTPCCRNNNCHTEPAVDAANDTVCGCGAGTNTNGHVAADYDIGCRCRNRCRCRRECGICSFLHCIFGCDR